MTLSPPKAPIAPASLLPVAWVALLRVATWSFTIGPSLGNPYIPLKLPRKTQGAQTSGPFKESKGKRNYPLDLLERTGSFPCLYWEVGFCLQGVQDSRKEAVITTIVMVTMVILVVTKIGTSMP